MTLAFHGKTRRRQVGLLLGGLVASLIAVFIGVSIYQEDLARAALITVVDDGGANDEVGQKDLTQMSVDYAGVPASLAVGWNWDEPSVSGGNSLDACSLFDTDGDGNANYAVCGIAHFEGDPPVAVSSIAVWSCSDNRNDRCTAPNEEMDSPGSVCTTGVSTDDPFAAGDHSPQDLKASCSVVLSEVGGSGAGLINVCSYESSSPTSNPEDCVLAPENRALVTIIKDVVGGTAVAGDFQITLTATNVAGGPASFPGAAAPGTTRSVSAGTFSLNETLALDYAFTSITGAGCPDALGQSATIAAGANVTCTITNTYAPPPPNHTIKICKVVEQNNDGVDQGGSFSGEVRHWTATQTFTAVAWSVAGVVEGGDPVCTTVSTIPPDHTFNVTEFGFRPAAWVSDASGYPWYQDNQGMTHSANVTTVDYNGNVEVTFHNKSNPATRSVEVCKVVVGNGDTFLEPSFAYGFDIRPDGAASISGSNSAAEPNPDTDGSVGAEACTTRSVPTDKDFDVVEWMSRPDGWTDDTAYPKYSVNGGAQVSNNTTTKIAKGTAAVKVTFYNKAVVRTREIVITKNLVNLGGYVPTASDVPAFTLDPGQGTTCAAAVQQDDDTWTVTCTVPYGWSGTVTEGPHTGWRDVGCPAEAAAFTFCNEPFGTIRIEKLDSVDGAAGPDWEFTVSGGAYSGTATADEGDPFEADVPLSATPVTISEVLARSAAQCAVANTYYTVATPPSDPRINTPGEVRTWLFQNLPCGILGTGGLIIEKHLDLNGDGDANDTGEGPLAGWTFTTTGTGIATADQVKQTSASGAILDYVSNFDAGTILTTAETVQSGYHITAVTLDGVGLGAAAMNTAQIIGGETRVIRYYNQPLGGITVVKETYNVVDGLESRNFGDDDGWLVTVSSVACGVEQSDTTDANGVAVFAGLPICSDYRVAEDLAAPGAPGYTPRTTAVWTNITPVIGGTTMVTFVNETRVTTPEPTPTPTPVPPTPTPVPPTATPVPPTATATPVTPAPESTVAGERTPRPATPVAPSSGEGPAPSDGTGANLALIVVGLLVLAVSVGATVRVATRR